MRDLEKIIILLLLAVAVTIPACSQKEPKQAVEAKQAGQGETKPVTTASGLTGMWIW